MNRLPLQMLDGILIIDKPAEWTSHDVVAKLRNLLKIRRIGHTGTLDPFATGVLVVCLNRATRLVQFLTGHDKEYLATMRLGEATDTGDLTGAPAGPPIDAGGIAEAQIREALDQFRGVISQVPPMYSAKKVAGRKLYELAREGKKIERAPVEVEIKSIELLDLQHPQGLTMDVTIRVLCSAGTYIRTLAEDIGKKLGVGAHLIALRRIRAGRCGIEQANTLERITELSAAGKIGEIVLPMIQVLDFAELPIDEEEMQAISHGQSIRHSGPWADRERVSLCDSGRNLMAIAEYVEEEQALAPRIVLSSTGE